MPIFFHQPDDEELKKQQQGQPGGAQGMILSGETSGNAAPAPTSGKTRPGLPTASGRFVPIQKFLEAHRGGVVREKLVDPFENRWQQARNTLNQAETEFKGTVDSKAVRPDLELIKQASQNAVQFASDPTKREQVLRQRDAQYSGPRNLGDLETGQTAVTGARNADQEVEHSKTEAGRLNLLNQVYRRPTSTRGEMLLDQLLLQNDPESRAKLLDLQGRFDTLDKEAQEAQNRAGEYAAQAAKDAQTARQAFQDAFTGEQGAISTRMGDLEKRRDRAIAEKAAKEKAIREAFDSLAFDDYLANLTGVDRSGTTVYNLSLPDYLRVAADPTRGAMAAQEERAELAALAELAGLENPLRGDVDAATYDPNSAFVFDKEKFMADRAAAARAMDRELNNTYLDLFDIYGPFGGDTGITRNPSPPKRYINYSDFLQFRDYLNSVYGNPQNYQYLSPEKIEEIRKEMMAGFDSTVGKPFYDIMNRHGYNRRIRKG